MWTSNKPAGWLFSLPENERSEQSRKMVEKVCNRAKERRKEILVKRKERFEEEKRRKQEDMKKKKERKIALSIAVDKIGGLWKSRQNIIDNLKNKDEKVKVSSLYTQLQYHSIVLSSSAPDNYYFQRSKTEKGRKIDFDSTTMVKHLSEIIDLNLAKFKEKDLDDILLSQIVAELNLPSTEQPFKIVSSEKITEVLEKQKEKLKNTLQGARTKHQSNRCEEMLETFT